MKTGSRHLLPGSAGLSCSLTFSIPGISTSRLCGGESKGKRRVRGVARFPERVETLLEAGNV